MANDKGSGMYILGICLVATLGGLLFGYDTGVISGAIEPLTAKFSLDAAMKGWVSGCVLIGCAIGVLLVGPLSDKFGRKLAMYLAAVMFLISSIGTALPESINTFILFRFIGGLGIGIASISTPMYIAEITPARIRGRMVAVNQIAIVSGLAVVYFANYGIAKVGPHYAGVPEPSSALVQTINTHITPGNVDPKKGSFTLPYGAANGIQPGMLCSIGQLKDEKQQRPSRDALATIANVAENESQAIVFPEAMRNVDWKIVSSKGVEYPKSAVMILSPGDVWNIHSGWRWMFASGILPSILFFLLLIGIPESPRWLIEMKQESRARAILVRVGGPEFATTETANIKSALQQEKGTWGELSGQLFYPLALGIILAVLQQITGINVFMYFGTTIFNNMSAKTGIDAGMLNQAIIGGTGVFLTIIAIATVDKWGRKPLMLLGTTGMMIALVGMGVMAQTMKDPAEAAQMMLGFIIMYIACFGLSVGPVVWVILAEIFPTAVRGRALGIATCCLWIADYIVIQTFPIMDGNKYLVEKFNHAFPFYVYAFFCVVLIIVVWRFVPETKGKTLEEIEDHWMKRK